MRPNPSTDNWSRGQGLGAHLGKKHAKTACFLKGLTPIKAFQYVTALANAYQQHGREVLFGVSLCWRWFFSQQQKYTIFQGGSFPEKNDKTKKTVGMMRMMSFQASFCLVGYGYMVLTLGRALVWFGMWPCIWWGATSCSIWEFDGKNINITLWTDIYFYTYSYPSICVGFWQIICFKLAMYRQYFQILVGYI